MLGCQDFCGYYDWSFRYIRRRFGQAAVELLWREAIGGDSQKHYSDPAAQSGLRALYNAWVNTGKDEQCDWTFTLDEAKNVLRWDMRECPSKGFLIHNDLNADEDYCNHCMGWIIPMLEGIGAEIVEHEHNHCGQCWATMRIKHLPSEPLQVECDIRNDPRWKHGYLDRWSHNQPAPHLPAVCSASDPCEVLQSWFREVDSLVMLDKEANRQDSPTPPKQGLVATEAVYIDRNRCPSEPLGVLIGCPPADLAAVAARYHATTPENRPLLMHAYLPAVPFVDFPSAGLPRPVPILPLLIRENKYVHQPGGPYPTSEEFLALVISALGKKTVFTSK